MGLTRIECVYMSDVYTVELFFPFSIACGDDDEEREGGAGAKGSGGEK